jgi:hypothetical protein
LYLFNISGKSEAKGESAVRERLMKKEVDRKQLLRQKTKKYGSSG